jgi:5,10-methenyltetrahydrofolate synthetase
MSESSVDALTASRQALRERLLAARRAFVADATQRPERQAALARHLMSVLAQLAPERLGVYGAVQSEFDAAAVCLGDESLEGTPLALPFSFRHPVRMDYRHWNRLPPTLRDECGIPACEGAVVVPDVVLAPCVGYTASGYRLGHGGGYFDRWLAAHPHVTVIGVAWSVGEIDEAELQPQPHDRSLDCVVSELGVR